MIKQIIVIRKDLNMRKGKMCAQAAHASMKVLLDNMDFFQFEKIANLYFNDEIYEWLADKFTKIVAGCDTKEELVYLYTKAKKAKLPCTIIEDSGATEFKEPTLTAIAIGPAQSEDIDKITGYLKLL